MWSRSGGSEAVIETARGFFIFCAITQLMSGLVIVMASILRGLRDANAVLWLVMLGYWGVGLGGAGLFGFALGLGGTGTGSASRSPSFLPSACWRRGFRTRSGASVSRNRRVCRTRRNQHTCR
jgi:Na+-driven multidrug efflux pump